MKIGDLVVAKGGGYALSSPVVQPEWIGIIIGFTGDCVHSDGKTILVPGSQPIVYWNEKFHHEVEFNNQVEVISI